MKMKGVVKADFLRSLFFACRWLFVLCLCGLLSHSLPVSKLVLLARTAVTRKLGSPNDLIFS